MELIVGNRQHYFWSDFNITLNFNAIASTFNFKYLYDRDATLNTDVSQPLTYKQCVLTDNNERILTGVILSHGFNSFPIKKFSSISGYSKAGILSDITVPVDMYPLQFDGLTLLEITNKLASRFDIKVVVDDIVSTEMNQRIDEIELDPDKKIGEFLSKTASEKNIVLTHTDDGNLLFTRAKTDQKSIYDFGVDTEAISKTLKVNGQKMFSQVTAMAESEDEVSNASESTIQNPYVKIFRPTVVKQELGDDLTTQKVARTAIGQQLRNIKLIITTKSWYDKNGDNWRPNRIVTVLDREINLLKRSKWFIETVTYSGTPQDQVSILTCVLPEVYNEDEIIPVF